jgi:hypothetical protein
MSVTPERWKEIEGLYHASLGQAPEKRDALLANASTEVRDIVHELLSEEKTGILDGPAWKIDTEPLTTPSAIVPGMTLGPYRIETSVRAGGMGEVFRASDSPLRSSLASRGGRILLPPRAAVSFATGWRRLSPTR